MPTRRKSLFLLHPWRLDVPLLILLASGLLVTGMNLPFLYIKKLIFFQEQYSLFQSIASMWQERFYLLALVIVCFSIVFPILKLFALAVLWLMPFDQEERRHYLSVVSFLGKWSMMDVFVIAVLITLAKASVMFDAAPGVGIYVFAAAILLSMVASFLMERLARQPVRSRN